MNSKITPDGKITIPLELLVGSFRTFGRHGPAYEVLGVAGIAPDEDPRLHIRVVESGEELDYPLRDAIADPLAE